MEPFTQDDADRVSEKLRTFYDALSEAEQRVIDALMVQAANTGDVTGYAVDAFIWFQPPPTKLGPTTSRIGENRFRLGWDINANKRV